MSQSIDAESASLITRLAAHISGEWVEASYPLQLDQAPQALGSALTYGRRYSLQALVCVASEDDDDGAAAQPTSAKKKTAPVVRPPKGEGISLAQRKRMFAIATKSGWSTEQMKDHLRLKRQRHREFEGLAVREV